MRMCANIDNEHGAEALTDNHWKKSIFRSFRLSPALLEMIQTECKFRNIDFSDYIRYAALAAMKRGNRVSRTETA